MTDPSSADVEPTSDPAAESDADADPAPEPELEPEPDRTTVRSGRNFEEVFRLDAAEAGDFLIELGEALRGGEEVRLTTDEWELPFAFGEPIELEIDFDGVGEPELEIELELPGRTDEKAPTVE